MNGRNIGKTTYNLMHMLSQGLQGKPLFHPTTKEAYFPGMTDSKEIREWALNPRDTLQSSSWGKGEENLMLFVDNWKFDSDKRKFEKEGLYNLSDIFLRREDLIECYGSQGLELPPLPGFSIPLEERIWILRELNEAQIHFYGNKVEKDIPKHLMVDFSPLSRKNLGAELAYALDVFLEKNPFGRKGKDLGPSNIHYEINGKRKDKYDIRHAIENGTNIFVDLSLQDIRDLTKKE